jgi:hypothetical protein
VESREIANEKRKGEKEKRKIYEKVFRARYNLNIDFKEDKRMKRTLVIICIVFQCASCAMFDGISDVSVSLNPPDEIAVANNARVSTLRSMDGKIIRDGAPVYQFHFDVDVPAKKQGTIKIDDFVIQDGDKVRLTDADFSWDM